MRKRKRSEAEQGCMYVCTYGNRDYTGTCVCVCAKVRLLAVVVVAFIGDL